MSRQRMRGAIALVAALCLAPVMANEPAPGAGSLANTVWVMGEQPPAGTRGPTLGFGRDGSARGSDGCNAFSTSYAADKGALRFTRLVVATQVVCPTEDEAQLARVFIDALESTRTWRIAGGRLVLLDAGGAVLLELEPQRSK